jgi:CheY-like chemotaxis protein
MREARGAGLLPGQARPVGFTVVEACNADEARAYLDSGSQVDLIFSDIHMPGAMNGLQFARHVRARLPTLPIILTSGEIAPEDTGGLGPFVAKPYNPDRAISIVFEALGLSRFDGEKSG